MTHHHIIRQTHFIGISIPADIAATLEECRAWMRTRYGCKSGQTTPLHITLVPPFQLLERFTKNDIQRAMDSAVRTWLTRDTLLTCFINGFGAFSSRTIFAHVENSCVSLQTDKKSNTTRHECMCPTSPEKSRWQEFRSTVFESLLKACPETTRRDTRTFTPHITIANRDIPHNAFPDALTYFDSLDFHELFDVRNITVFVRYSNTWIADSVFAW